MFLWMRVDNIPVGGLIFSLMGLMYSLLVSFTGTDSLCLTSGCNVVSELRIFGISPWWAACVLFQVIFFLCLFRLRSFAYILALLFILGDCLFLALMLFIAPCFSCLLVALVIFCTWVALRRRWDTLMAPRRISVGALSFVWLLLFLVNSGLAFAEIVAPRPLVELEGSRIDVYFSPECPVCVQAVERFHGQASFYAIGKNADDIRAIAFLRGRLKEGQNLKVALTEYAGLVADGVFAAPALGWFETCSLWFSALRSQARIARLGYKTLPVIMYEGLPKVESSDLPIDFGQAPGCPQ